MKVEKIGNLYVARHSAIPDRKDIARIGEIFDTEKRLGELAGSPLDTYSYKGLFGPTVFDIKINVDDLRPSKLRVGTRTEDGVYIGSFKSESDRLGKFTPDPENPDEFLDVNSAGLRFVLGEAEIQINYLDTDYEKDESFCEDDMFNPKIFFTDLNTFVE